jgi:hypothetical protein
VAVLLGSGNGSFAAATYFTVNTEPRWVVAGDFTGDGILDLAAAHAGAAYISVLPGVGNGTFGPAAHYATASTLFHLAAADLNHDHRLDLVAAHYTTTSGLSVSLARPDGTFSAPETLMTGTTTQAITVGDFDGDTHPDLVTVNSPGFPLTLLRGRGDGAFLAPLNFVISGGAGAVLAGEFTGDTHLDVVTGNWHHNTVALYAGNGDGSFQHTSKYVTAGGVITKGIKADFNRDGNLDLATLSTDTDLATIFLGRGDGSLVQPTSYYDPGPAMHSLAVADLNGDGTLDLVTAGFDEQASSGGEYAVLLGNGEGVFTNQMHYLAHGNGAEAIAVGDFNEDNKPDLVLAYYYEGKVSILQGSGTGTFTLTTNYSISYGAENVFTGDYNRDKHIDVLVGADGLLVMPGRGDGTFGAAKRYPVPAGFHVMAMGDLNADGHADAVTGWFDDTSVTVLLGRADGSFAIVAGYYLGNGVDSVALEDINSDGSLDIVAGNYYFSSALAGIGDGSFRDPVQLPVEGPVLAVGDYNRDGKPDLALARSERVEIVLNRTVPALQVEALGGDAVRLAWPNWTGYALESSTNLFMTSALVTNQPAQIGNQNVLTNAVGSGSTLYRLTTD